MTTNDPRADALEGDLEDLFTVAVPAAEFQTPEAAPTPIARSRRKLAGVAAVAAAAVLGAVLVVPSFGSGSPKVASAQELIERSIAAADALETNPANYHMVTVARSSGAETITESWVGGTNRYRVEDRTTVEGRVMLNGTVMADDEMWIYQGPADALVVAHGPRIFSVIPAPSSLSLAEHLAGWNDTGCFRAEVVRRERVGERDAHVIAVEPKVEGCPHPRKPVKAVTLWLDVETEMALKMDYEGDTPDHSSSFEVTLYETFASLPDSTFNYTPPAGARVVEFRDASGLKEALAGVYMVPRGSRVILEHDWRVEGETPNSPANTTPGP